MNRIVNYIDYRVESIKKVKAGCTGKQAKNNYNRIITELKELKEYIKEIQYKHL